MVPSVIGCLCRHATDPSEAIGSSGSSVSAVFSVGSPGPALAMARGSLLVLSFAERQTTRTATSEKLVYLCPSPFRFRLGSAPPFRAFLAKCQVLALLGPIAAAAVLGCAPACSGRRSYSPFQRSRLSILRAVRFPFSVHLCLQVTAPVPHLYWWWILDGRRTALLFRAFLFRCAHVA